VNKLRLIYVARNSQLSASKINEVYLLERESELACADHHRIILSSSRRSHQIPQKIAAQHVSSDNERLKNRLGEKSHLVEKKLRKLTCTEEQIEKSILENSIIENIEAKKHKNVA